MHLIDVQGGTIGPTGSLVNVDDGVKVVEVSPTAGKASLPGNK